MSGFGRRLSGLCDRMREADSASDRYRFADFGLGVAEKVADGRFEVSFFGSLQRVPTLRRQAVFTCVALLAGETQLLLGQKNAGQAIMPGPRCWFQSRSAYSLD
jgi:hypothetical protein